MAGEETKQEEIARRIKHKRKKEDFRRAMKVWEALKKEYINIKIDAGYFYSPYVPIMRYGSILFNGETT